MAREGDPTLAEAADRLGVHYMTAYRYVRTGLLPAEKVGRRWLVDPEVLEALVAGRAGGIEPGGGGAGRAASAPAGRAGYALRMERRLVAGDEAGAWKLVEDAMASGVDPSDVLLEVLTPALAAIGSGWRAGDLRVVDEHQATAVVGRLVARLGPRFSVRGEPIGRVIVGAAPGDMHALPSSILRDLLRGRRFDAVDLGGDAPPESWADAVRASADQGIRLVAVGMGAMAQGVDDGVAAAIAAIRTAGPLGAAVPVVLGGSAIPDGDVARRLGADRYTRSTAEAVDTIVSLAT